MQAVILCGGQGTRIRDVAEDIPKPMVPIGGRPILWHVMKIYASHGIKDFVLCLGYKSWSIKRYFLDYHLAGSDFTLDLGGGGSVDVHGGDCEDWRITMAETGEETMTGGRVQRIEKYLRGDRFCLTYADGVGDVDIGRLLKFHAAHGKTGTVTAVQQPGRFGELEIDGAHTVNEFAEKPAVSKGFISGGYFVFERRFLKRLSSDPKLTLEQAPLMRLARDGELAAFEHEGFWHPMDGIRDYKYLNDLWARNSAPWRTWDAAQSRAAA